MRLLLTGSMDNGKIVSRKCQAGKNPQEPDAKLAQLACHNQNSFFLSAMGYGIRNSHPPTHLSPRTLIPLEHSSPWNTHPPGTLIPLEHSSPLEPPSPWNTHPPLSIIKLILM